MEQVGGYDVNCIEDVPDLLICVICQMVLKEPVLLVECGHTFCRSCFDEMKENAGRRNEALLCPTDRTKVDVNMVFDNKAISRLVLDLGVKCNHYLDGCQWTGELRNLEIHLDRDCRIREKERSSLLMQLQKRMESYEKLLEEKDEKIQSYEKRLEENERRMQRYDQCLEEKGKRLQVCEKRLDDKDKEYESLLAWLYQKENEITTYREPWNELADEQPVSAAQNTIVQTSPLKKTSSPSQEEDTLITKVRSEWNARSNDMQKYAYIQQLCDRKQEQLLIEWLEISSELWDFIYQGYTILHNAAIGGCVEVIGYICNPGRISINVQSNYGRTPLYSAVENNKYNAVEALIHHGCDINLKNCDGHTALDAARSSGRNEIKILLQLAGGKYGKDC